MIRKPEDDWSSNDSNLMEKDSDGIYLYAAGVLFFCPEIGIYEKLKSGEFSKWNC